LAQHEKILKELEKRMDFEKEKSGKLMEGLKAADEENKGLKKVKNAFIRIKVM
jgi:hypothetical protein